MQCEYVKSAGQCRKTAVHGNFCEDHSRHAAKANLNQYLISTHVLGDSPQRHGQAEQLKDVSAEIMLIRSLLEARVNMIDNDAELMAAMPILKDYALTVEKLALTCHAMDVKLGNLLDKQALMTLAQKLITIIDTSIRTLIGTTPTPQVVDELVEQIGQELVEAVASMENKP